MSYTVTIATEAERDLVVAVIRQAAAQRIRTATKAAGMVKTDKDAKRDVRASSVRVAMVLAEADTLTTLADDLEAMTQGPAVLAATGPATPTGAAINGLNDEQLATIPFPGDDGTSPEAQRIAALAGLSPDLPEDPETNATAEDLLDEPADIDLGVNP
jgi:hypothetical protein